MLVTGGAVQCALVVYEATAVVAGEANLSTLTSTGMIAPVRKLKAR